MGVNDPLPEGVEQTACPKEELCHQGLGHHISGHCVIFGFSLFIEHKERSTTETPAPGWGKDEGTGFRLEGWPSLYRVDGWGTEMAACLAQGDTTKLG